jgi:HSP20 family molecular chaperone IbpA
MVRKGKDDKSFIEQKQEPQLYRMLPNVYSDFDAVSKEFSYEIHLAGVKKENVKFRVLPDLFDLQAKRDEQIVYNLTDYFPYEVDTESVKATFENGLLRFTGKVKDPMKDAVEIKLV